MIHVDDAGFVRAPPGPVYRTLTDMSGWPAWWRGVMTTRLPADEETWEVTLRRGVRRRLHVTMTPHAWRHDEGFALALAGDLDGRAEFWLERSSTGGTVVHHVVQAEARGGAPATLTTYRAVLRWGLWGLKDVLHQQVRDAIGLDTA